MESELPIFASGIEGKDVEKFKRLTLWDWVIVSFLIEGGILIGLALGRMGV